MPLSFRPFFLGGYVTKTKLVCLGRAGNQLFPELVEPSSLKHIEHVSLADHLRPGISRHPANASPQRAATGEAPALAAMRRWFFARKPDAGFILMDFPATLLQAIVFDEWLEARGESLDAVLAKPGDASVPPELLKHYSEQGLLCEAHACHSAAPLGAAALAA